MKEQIGFIGQGWIGKNYADDFESRGHNVVRYALEEKYVVNKEKIANCTIVFIAVPTPTTEQGFDDSFVRSVLPLIKKGSIAVIKSTLLPGTTKALQADFPDILLLHSPEFLAERTAAHDAAHPNRNIVGIPDGTELYQNAANRVLSVLPGSPYQKVMDSTDAEMVKYAGNCFLYTKVVFMNLLFDVIAKQNGDFTAVREALVHDPRIGESHTNPIHTSGHDYDSSTVKRGAGGHCFIKDFEAFRQLYASATKDEVGDKVFAALIQKNLQLLVTSQKDLDLIQSVYGDVEVLKKALK